MKMICVMEDGRIVQNEPMDAQEMSGILLNAVLNMLKYFVSIQETDEEKKACAEELYDMFNIQASVLLQNLIPDKELRPDLTAEAIMEKENEILDKATETNKVVEFPKKNEE